MPLAVWRCKNDSIHEGDVWLCLQRIAINAYQNIFCIEGFHCTENLCCHRLMAAIILAN